MQPREDSAFIFWNPPTLEERYNIFARLGNNLSKPQIEKTAQYVCAIAKDMETGSGDTLQKLKEEAEEIFNELKVTLNIR